MKINRKLISSLELIRGGRKKHQTHTEKLKSVFYTRMRPTTRQREWNWGSISDKHKKIESFTTAKKPWKKKIKSVFIKHWNWRFVLWCFVPMILWKRDLTTMQKKERLIINNSLCLLMTGNSFFIRRWCRASGVLLRNRKIIKNVNLMNKTWKLIYFYLFTFSVLLFLTRIPNVNPIKCYQIDEFFDAFLTSLPVFMLCPFLIVHEKNKDGRGIINHIQLSQLQ